MRTRQLLPSAIYVLTMLLVVLTASSACAAPATISLRSTRQILLADGKHTTDIIAEVKDSSGRPAQDVEVQFNTTLGNFTQSRVLAFGGRASTQMTSAPIAGTAHITATVASNGLSGVSNPIDVVFTDDPDATFEGNAYIQVVGASYLAYSVSDRMIEAHGKEGGAKLQFRNFEVSADRMQLECTDQALIRATGHITLKRGKKILLAERLYYSMQSGQGYAMTEIDGRLTPVTIGGENLIITPLTTPIPTSYQHLRELQVKMVIVAKSITYFPGDRLQFRRPHFYQDQVQLYTLPYYELPLNSEQLFSDHFISVGTSGFGLELPFYYNLTPRSSGIVYLRHQPQIGRSSFATQPGWSIDMVQGYSSMGGTDNRYDGAYGFTGLTRSDWGFRWSHNQEFSQASQGSFYFDFPNHDSLFSSANLTHQMKNFRIGTNLAAGQTFTGSPTTSLRTNTYAESNPAHLLGSKTVMFTVGTRYSMGSYDSRDPLLAKQSDSTEEITMRAFTRPWRMGSRTTLSDSVTVGHLWSQHQGSGLIGLATLSLDHALQGGGAVNLTYDLVDRPNTFIGASGKQRVSLTYSVAQSKHITVSMFGSAYLDSNEAAFLADMSYRIDKNYRLLLSATAQKYGGESYQDLEFTLGRRIGIRELQLTYSTFNHRISFDFTATRF